MFRMRKNDNNKIKRTLYVRPQTPVRVFNKAPTKDYVTPAVITVTAVACIAVAMKTLNEPSAASTAITLGILFTLGSYTSQVRAAQMTRTAVRTFKQAKQDACRYAQKAVACGGIVAALVACGFSGMQHWQTHHGDLHKRFEKHLSSARLVDGGSIQEPYGSSYIPCKIQIKKNSSGMPLIFCTYDLPTKDFWGKDKIVSIPVHHAANAGYRVDSMGAIIPSNTGNRPYYPPENRLSADTRKVRAAILASQYE